MIASVLLSIIYKRTYWYCQSFRKKTENFCLPFKISSFWLFFTLAPCGQFHLGFFSWRKQKRIFCWSGFLSIRFYVSLILIVRVRKIRHIFSKEICCKNGIFVAARLLVRQNLGVQPNYARSPSFLEGSTGFSLSPQLSPIVEWP